MEILKWYSIILIGLGIIANLLLAFKERDITRFISFLLFIPLFIYLILK